MVWFGVARWFAWLVFCFNAWFVTVFSDCVVVGSLCCVIVVDLEFSSVVGCGD